MDGNDKQSPVSGKPSPLKDGQSAASYLRSGTVADERMICPQCGYAAQTPDDPLLTKHEGRGECPQCGIIPQKLRQKPMQKEPPSSQKRTSASHSRATVKPIVKLSLVCAIVLVAVIGSLHFKSSGSSETSRPHVAVDRTPPAKQASAQPKAASLKEIRDNYRKAIEGRNDLESLLAAAETAAASVNAIPIGDPKIDSVRSSCSNSLDALAKHLITCKEAKEQLASVDADIAAAKTDMERELAAMNADLDVLKNKLGGMTETLRHNKTSEITGSYQKKMWELQPRRNKLAAESKYNSRALDKVEFECWKSF